METSSNTPKSLLSGSAGGGGGLIESKKSTTSDSRRPFGQNPRLLGGQSHNAPSFTSTPPNIPAFKVPKTPFQFEFKTPSSTSSTLTPSSGGGSGGAKEKVSPSKSLTTSDISDLFSASMSPNGPSFTSTGSSSGPSSQNINKSVSGSGNNSQNVLFKSPSTQSLHSNSSPDMKRKPSLHHPKDLNHSPNVQQQHQMQQQASMGGFDGNSPRQSMALQQYRMSIDNLLDYGASFFADAEHWKQQYQTTLLDVDRLVVSVNEKESHLKGAREKITLLQKCLDETNTDLDVAKDSMSRKLDLILDSSKVGTQLIEEKLKGHREMEECISVLKVRIEELEAQRESLDLEKHGIEANLSVEIDRLKDEIGEKSNSVTIELSKFTERENDLKNSLCKMEDNVASLKSEKDQLQRELEAITSEKSDIQRQLEDNNDELQKLLVEMKSREDQYSKLEELYQMVSASVNIMKGHVADIGIKWDLLQEDNAELKEVVPRLVVEHLLKSSLLKDVETICEQGSRATLKGVEENWQAWKDIIQKSSSDIENKLDVNVVKAIVGEIQCLKNKNFGEINHSLDQLKQLVTNEAKPTEHSVHESFDQLESKHRDEIGKLNEEHKKNLKNWVDLSNSGQQKIDSLSAEVRLLKEQLDSIAREKQLIENELETIKKREQTPEVGQERKVKRVSFTKSHEPNYNDIYRVLTEDLKKEETSVTHSNSKQQQQGHGNIPKRRPVDASDSLVKRRKKILNLKPNVHRRRGRSILELKRRCSFGKRMKTKGMIGRGNYMQESILLKGLASKAKVAPEIAVKSRKKILKPCHEGLLTAHVEPKYILPSEEAQKQMPRLAHGLERVLFNPGIHYLRDPRTGIYNYDPCLRFITQPEHFDYKRVPGFVPPSKDEQLRKIGEDNSCKFIGSTSSTSGILSLIYLFISNYSGVSLDFMAKDFQLMNSDYAKFTRSAQMVTLKPYSGSNLYAISAFKPLDSESILSKLGTSMEYFLTRKPEDFAKLLKSTDLSLLDDELLKGSDSYAYCHYDDFLLRSQLDCYNPHLPKLRFDIKTRGTAAIRYNIDHYQHFIDYRIHKYHGKYNSYSKEYYDMIRSVFLKYQFQARMGNMDGIFVAYHNTEEIFGFQYIPLEEIDNVLFGCTQAGNQYFRLSLKLLSEMAQRVMNCWPGEYARILLTPHKDRLRVYAERVDKPFAEDEKFAENPLTTEKVRIWDVEIDRIVNGEISNGSDYLSFNDVVDIGYRIYSINDGSKNNIKSSQLEEYERRRILAVDKFANRKDVVDEFMLKQFSRYFSPLDKSTPIYFDNGVQ